MDVQRRSREERIPAGFPLALAERRNRGEWKPVRVLGAKKERDVRVTLASADWHAAVERPFVRSIGWKAAAVSVERGKQRYTGHEKTGISLSLCIFLANCLSPRSRESARRQIGCACRNSADCQGPFSTVRHNLSRDKYAIRRTRHSAIDDINIIHVFKTYDWISCRF